MSDVPDTGVRECSCDISDVVETDSGDESQDEVCSGCDFVWTEDEEIDQAFLDASSSTSSSDSPITRSPQPLPRRDRSRSRSRSPLRDPLAVVKVIYDEDDMPLEESLVEAEFFIPDSHDLYETVDHTSFLSESSIKRGNSRGRRLRGRVRGGGHLSSRGQTRDREATRRRQHGWRLGQPLGEIWITDNDVPRELRNMAMQVLRTRQARVKKIESKRKVRRACEEERNYGNDRESLDDDVYEDAVDLRSNSLLDGVDRHFVWSSMKTFRNVEDRFIPERTGSVSSYSNPYDAFRSYWDDSILQLIVDETNRHATQIQSAAFQAAWYPTNADELLCHFAFWIMTGIIRMPTIKCCFSNDFLLKTEVFSRITTFKRYTDLNRALYFMDTSPTDSANPTNSDAASFDQMQCPLGPIIDHLNKKFQSNYVLSKDICIDEGVSHLKGNEKFERIIRTKAGRFAIKTFELYESATGYLWSFLLDTCKESTPEPGLGKSHFSVVLKLIQPLLNKGHRLFVDDWYTSPLLARILKRNGTDCVGTIHASRVDVPKLCARAPLKKGQLIAMHSGDVCILSWQDKQRINMISTCHGSAIGLAHVSSRPSAESFKPQSVLDYDRAMAVVDRPDYVPELCVPKKKWYMKDFKRLLTCSIHNSRILFESCGHARKDTFHFPLLLVDAILRQHCAYIPLSRRRGETFDGHFQMQLVHHSHWPVPVLQLDVDRARNRLSRQLCVVCLREGRKSQRTRYRCEDCGVPLCVEGCFKKYHTQLNTHIKKK